jgi:hypothetical protein
MSVSRRARLLDLAGIALMLLGAACFVWAHFGLARLQAEGVVLVARGQTFGKLREYQRWAWLWWSGLAMITTGVGIAVWAAVEHRRNTTAGIGKGTGDAGIAEEKKRERE